IPDFGGKRDAQGQPYRYYTCGAVHREAASAECPVRRVPAAVLEQTVVGLMAAVGRREEIVQAVIGATKDIRRNNGELRRCISEIDRELDQVARRLGNCVEAIAAGGAEVVADELRERATTLKTDKQRLIVERERLRQDLAAYELGAMDVARLREALTRFHDLLPQLSAEEQKQLIALCVDRLEIRAKAGGSADGAGRLLEIRLRLHAAQLVAGMEERVVVRVREARLSPITRRVMTIDGRVRIGHAGQPSEIVAPVHEMVGSATVVPKAKETDLRHPLHLAVAWRRKLAANPALSHAAFARKMDVSEATVSRTLLMLKLIPEIQEVLLKVRQREDLRRFSLNKMVVIAALPADAQREGFMRLSH
ncbi:MAG: hypothetical protein WC378_11570, partial [Opitutaceae bacterium]